MNLITQGNDYGWPDETIGGPYSGDSFQDWDTDRYVSRHQQSSAPMFSWLPSIGPSDLFIYQGDHFPAWQGDIMLATLRDESIRRLRLQNGKVIFDERIEIGERIRDIEEMDTGQIILTFDSGGIGVLSNR